jgi:hypothetical protein
LSIKIRSNALDPVSEAYGAVQQSDLPQLFVTSWPGIAVRKTASLPLAYVPGIHVLLSFHGDEIVDGQVKPAMTKSRTAVVKMRIGQS